MTTTQAIVARLRSEGEVRLASFTSEELVAVGADGPIQGIALSKRLAGMGAVALTAALSSALRSLVARGFVHPNGAATDTALGASEHLTAIINALGLDGDEGDDEHEGVSVPLSGDLAVVVALRREPALVGLVSMASPDKLELLGSLAHGRTDAILHAFADHGGLGGVLDERRSPLGVHAFSLRSLPREAQTLCDELADNASLEGDGDERWSELALDVLIPGEQGSLPSRILVRQRAEDSDTAITLQSAGTAPRCIELSSTAIPERLCGVLDALWRHDGAAVAALLAS